MKTIMVTIAAALISLSAAAYNPGNDPSDYCVTKKNGKTVVEYKGRTITKDVTLKDGTKIRSNGTVVLADGASVKLKDGECINENKISDEIRSRAKDSKNTDFDSQGKKEGEDRWDKSKDNKDYDRPDDQPDMNKQDKDYDKDFDMDNPDRNKDMNKKSEGEQKDYQKDYDMHHPDSLRYKSPK
jgi:hypothetical protein